MKTYDNINIDYLEADNAESLSDLYDEFSERDKAIVELYNALEKNKPWHSLVAKHADFVNKTKAIHGL